MGNHWEKNPNLLYLKQLFWPQFVVIPQALNCFLPESLQLFLQYLKKSPTISL